MKLAQGWQGLALGVLTWIGTGCAGYHLGSPHAGMLAGRTIQVLPVVNETVEPRLGEILTSALRRQVQREGTFSLAGSDPPDLILTTTVTSFHRHAVSFDPNDVLRPRDLQVALEARVRVVQRSSGQVVMDRSFQGRRLMRIGPDLASAERQTLPMVAEELARQVVVALAEGQW